MQRMDYPKQIKYNPPRMLVFTNTIQKW